MAVGSVVTSHWLTHGGFSLAGSVARQGENPPLSCCGGVSFLPPDVQRQLPPTGGKYTKCGEW